MFARNRWFIILSLVLAVSGVAHAAALTTQDCLNCHNVMPKQLVDARLFQSSVHSALGCTGCHSDVKAFPHTPQPEKVACDKCHGDAAKAFSESTHAAKWDLQGLKHPACLNCHGNAHEILSTSNPRSAIYPLNLPRTCGRCHGSSAMARDYGIANVYGLYIDSIHGFALTNDGLLVAASCVSCHGAHRILSPVDPQSPTYRKNVPATCGSCHAGIEAVYFKGVHGKALKAGSATAAVCTDCHTVHQIASVQTTAWQTRTVATCGNCHRQQLRSYRDTFHGQVTALGFVATARCWSCHESHRVLPPSDPMSSIAPQNLVSTCGKCHQGAARGFISFEAHPNPHDRALNPSLYYAALGMNLLLLSVFAFFGLHTLLWLVRSWSARSHNSAASRSGRPQ